MKTGLINRRWLLVIGYRGWSGYRHGRLAKRPITIDQRPYQYPNPLTIDHLLAPVAQ
ncbi:MAG: hypothetical protein ABIL18_02085 [candidate division WOR-3 bacterium]